MEDLWTGLSLSNSVRDTRNHTHIKIRGGSFFSFQPVTRVYLELQPMDEIRRAFESMDTDKTGAITALQLKNAIESLGDHADISEAEAMIQEAASTYTDRSKCLLPMYYRSQTTNGCK